MKLKKCSCCGNDFQAITSDRKTCSQECARDRTTINRDYINDEYRKKQSDWAKKSNCVSYMHTPESRVKAGRSIRIAKLGIPNTGKGALGHSRKGEMVCLISPKGVEFKTDCIRKFVRDNEHLFNKDDIKRRKDRNKGSTTEGNLTCRAMKGLQLVTSEQKNVWKGWRVRQMSM